MKLKFPKLKVPTLEDIPDLEERIVSRTVVFEDGQNIEVTTLRADATGDTREVRTVVSTEYYEEQKAPYVDVKEKAELKIYEIDNLSSQCQ